MTQYVLSGYIVMAAVFVLLMVVWFESTEVHNAKLQKLTLRGLNNHYYGVGFIKGICVASVVFGLIGMFIFTPDPIITYLPSIDTSID